MLDNAEELFKYTYHQVNNKKNKNNSLPLHD